MPMPPRLLLLAAALALAACGSVAGGCPSQVPQDTAATPTGCLRLAVAPAQRSYPPGADKITFTVTATNISSQSCAGSQQLFCGGPALNVEDGGGKVVWRHQRPAVPCPLLVRLLQPGEKMSSQVDWPSPGLGAGLYSVSGGQEDFGRSYFTVC